MAFVTKVCLQCGKEFQARVFQSRPPGRSKFCSRKCSTTHVSRKWCKQFHITKTCPICGAKFHTTTKAGGKKSCSKKCANKLRGIASGQRETTKVAVHCAQCGKPLLKQPSRIDGRKHFCNRACYAAYRKTHPTRPPKRFKIVNCSNCRKPIKRFLSRLKHNGRHYCSQYCYLSHAYPSSIEDTVADWLYLCNLPNERQVRLSRWHIDFCVNGSYVEVQGCYWHGCPEHCANLLAKRVQRRIERDKRLTEYCHVCHLQLLTIWEHDIRNNNFENLYALLPDQLRFDYQRIP